MYVTDSIRVFYGLYFVLVSLFMLWFILKVRRTPTARAAEKAEKGIDRRELVFLVSLAAVVVLAHAVTLSNLVPWQQWRLWSKPVPVERFAVEVEDYAFKFPATPMKVRARQFVEFNLTSKDVTYGFGVFRKDGTMVFQCSVLPGYNNRFVWSFSEPGSYDVRSTEYSGAEHSRMLAENAILVAQESEDGHAS